MNPDIEERFVHTIAHEYVHAQQPADDITDPTVLLAAELLISDPKAFLAKSGWYPGIRLR